MKDSLAPQNATTTDTTSTNEMQGWIEKKLLESERKEADEARQKLAETGTFDAEETLACRLEIKTLFAALDDPAWQPGASEAIMAAAQ